MVHQIKVSDTGRGIAARDIEKIFEPFFTTKEIDKGCGLGLTVVNEIIKCYNGTDQGQKPVEPGNDLYGQITRNAIRILCQTKIHYSILIVDDEPLIRKSLYEILKIAGFDAHTASQRGRSYRPFDDKVL